MNAPITTSPLLTVGRQKRLAMSETSRGRVMLHLLALRRDGRISWHLAGILRELRRSEDSADGDRRGE